mmetsp:Transcript_66257/g.104908  ORF Transcript_66257/g.104908 Transcript_66257/m.104908 type:complete len:203 (-) Transcript_66257:121-729(-)
MFQGGVSGQNGVVRLNHCCCNLRCWVDSKLQFGFLAIVNRQTLHEQRCKSRTCTSTKGVEDKESLQASALVRQFSDPVQNNINELLSNSVVSTSIVVSRIFFAGYQLFWVKQLSVSASPNLIDNSGFQVYEDSTRNVFSRSSFAEKRVKGIITTADGFVARHLAIRLNSMLQAVQLPTSISNLNSGLANVDRNTLTHFDLES